jgi:3-oxoacyl-[acyl-carrier protein] reductase
VFGDGVGPPLSRLRLVVLPRAAREIQRDCGCSYLPGRSFACKRAGTVSTRPQSGAFPAGSTTLPAGMDLGLAGKACVVTGASRGIGRESARQLCAEGAQVLLVARSEDDLRDAAAECGRAGAAAGGRAAPFVCDVTDPDAGKRILAEGSERFGGVDVLVNNAGTARWRDIDDVPDDDWQAAWDLNVMACLRAMRAVIPGMRERGWGRIVNVSSTAAKRPSRYMPEYSVAKAALLSLSRLYADRLAADGVLVNAICPGPTKSELWMSDGGLADQSAELSDLSGRAQAVEKAGAGRPIGRLAEVGEIAAAIVFLSSDRASYVAGAAWSVDGGTVQVIV